MNISEMQGQVINGKLTHDFSYGMMRSCKACQATEKSVTNRVISSRCTSSLFKFYAGPNHNNTLIYATEITLAKTAVGIAVRYDPMLDISDDEWALFSGNPMASYDMYIYGAIDLDEEWPVEETRIGLVKEEIDRAAYDAFMKENFR